MTQTVKGAFDVTLLPKDLAFTHDQPGLGRMSIDKQFHGELEATSKGEMLSSMSAVKGSAGYVAMERVTGTLQGKKGSFVLQHSASMDRGAQSMSITVVPDSGTDELTGLAGSLIIEIVEKKHYYVFTFEIEKRGMSKMDTRFGTLFDAPAVEGLRGRLDRLRPDARAQWGKMNVAQALAHMATTMEMSLGDRTPPRALIGRLIGSLIKPKALAAPMRQGNPTSPELRIADQRDFEAERKRLRGLIDRFAAGGPHAVTKAPHPFFGSMTTDEWALQMWKHVDHHLRQFGG